MLLSDVNQQCSLTVVVDGADLMLDALHVSLELAE